MSYLYFKRRNEARRVRLRERGGKSSPAVRNPFLLQNRNHDCQYTIANNAQTETRCGSLGDMCSSPVGLTFASQNALTFSHSGRAERTVPEIRQRTATAPHFSKNGFPKTEIDRHLWLNLTITSPRHLFFPAYTKRRVA